MGAWLNPEKHAPATCVIPNLVAQGQTVWVWVGGPEHLGDAGAVPLGMESVANSGHMLLPV